MKLKKVNKNILIGSLSIIGVSSILGTGIAIANQEKSGIDNSWISKDNTADKDFSSKVFLGTKLTKEEVKKLGWDQKISISLDDWAKYAPNVIQLGDFEKSDAPFYENNKLRTIQIPSKIQSINNFAFSNSSSLKNVFFEDNSQLFNIGDFAFNNSLIELINIPNSVYLIGKDVFGNNSSLPENVISLLSNFNQSKNIEPRVFEGTTLTKAEVQLLGWDTKTTITLDDWANQAPNVIAIGDPALNDGTIVDLSQSPFANNSILTSIQIPPTIQNINYGSFANATSLITVDFSGASQLQSIRRSAFEGSSILSITIPNSLTIIDKFAFNKTNSLTTVIFADNSVIETIGEGAFGRSAITSITIPDSVTSIGNNAFETTNFLNTISIPASLRGENATTPKYGFTQAQWDNINWRSLPFLGEILTKSDVIGLGWDTKTTITLDDWRTWAPNVTMISETATSGEGLNAAFSENTVLQSIEIPAKVTRINFGSFYNTTALTSLTFEANSQLNIIENAAIRLSNISSITLPNTLTHIGGYAFDGSGITSINIPDSVQSIGYESFRATASLANIEMPGHLKGASATTSKYGFTQAQWDSIVWRIAPFLGDTLTKSVVNGLGWDTKTTITLDDWRTWAPNVTMISETATSGEGLNAAFSENTVLQSIEIPAKVTRINFGSFYNTTALTSLTFEANSQLNIIENAAFRFSNIPSIILPNTLTSMGYRVFEGSGLTSINIPDEITYIRQDAFASTSSLQTVTFGADSKLYRIENAAFLNSSIVSINLPDSIQSILNNAFAGTSSLTDIEIPLHMRGEPETTPKYGFTQAQWDSINWRRGKFLGDILTRVAVIGLGWDTKTTITLDDWRTWAPNVTTISHSSSTGAGETAAFSGNTILQSIEIPAKVTRINFGSFYNTTALTSLTFEANSQLNLIENAAFRLSSVSSPIILPNTLTHIGDVAFEGSRITSINVPDSIQFIGNNSFAGTSSSLTNIEMPGNMRGVPATTAKYGFTQAQWDNINWRRVPFLGDILTKSVVISLEWDKQAIITLDDWMTWAPNVTQIGETTYNDGTEIMADESPFASNSILKSIEIPAKIISINHAAFFRTSALKTVTFLGSSQLESINRNAFQISVINSIDIPSSVKKIGSFAFADSLLKNINFAVDSQLTTIDSGCFYNSSLTSITIPDSVTTISNDRTFQYTAANLPGSQVSMSSSLKQGSALPLYGFSVEQWNSIAWRFEQFTGEILTRADVINLGWDTKTSITASDWALLAPNVTQIGESTYNDGTEVVVEASPFANNSILKSIEIPANVISINYAAFFGTTALKTVTFLGSSQLESINRSAFEASVINSIDIPSSVKKIGLFAFANSLLKNINFAVDSQLTTIDSGGFYNSSLTSITIPDSVTTISNDKTFGLTSSTLQGNQIKIPLRFKGTPAETPKYGFTQEQWDTIFWTGTITLTDAITTSFLVEFEEGSNIVQGPPLKWKATSSMSADATEITLSLQYAIGTTENNLIFDWSDYATLKTAIENYSQTNDILKSELNIYARMYIPTATGPNNDTIGGINYIWDRSIKKIYDNTSGTISNLFTTVGGSSATIPAGKFIRTYSKIPSTWSDSLSAEGNKSIAVKILSKNNEFDINYWTERGVKLEVSPNGGASWTQILQFNNDVFDASATNKMQFRLSVVDAQLYEIYGAISTTTPIPGIETEIVEKDIIAKIQLKGVLASDLLSSKLSISGTTHNLSIVENPELYTVSGLDIATAKTFFEIKYSYDGITYLSLSDFTSALNALRAEALNILELSSFRVRYEFTALGLSTYYSSEVFNDPDANPNDTIKVLDTSNVTKTIDATSQINDISAIKITGSTEIIIWGNMGTVLDIAPFAKIEYGTYVRQSNGTFNYVWSETQPSSIYSKTVPEGENQFPIAIRFMPKQPSDRVEIGSILGAEGIFNVADTERGYEVNTDGLVSIINIDTTDLVNRLVFTGYADNLNNGATSSAMEASAFELVDIIFRNQVELKYELSTSQGQWISLDQLKAAMLAYLTDYSNATSGIMIFSNGTIPGVTIKAQFIAKDPSKFTVVSKPEPLVELNTSGIKTKVDLRTYVEILKTQKVIPSGTSAPNIGTLTFPGMPVGNMQFGGRTYEQIEAIISSSIDIEFKAPGFHSDAWVPLDRITSINFDNELFIRFNVKNAAKANIELSLVTENDYESHLANGFKLNIDLPIEIQVNPADLVSEITLSGNTKILSVNDDQVYANLIAKNPNYEGKVKILYTIGKTPIALDPTQPLKTEFTKAELIDLLSLRNIDILLADKQITGRYALADGINPEDYKIKDETPVILNITNVLLFINKSNYYEVASKVNVSGTSSGIVWGSEIDTLSSSLSEGLILQYSIDNTVSASDPNDDSRWTTIRPTTISPNLKFLAIRLVTKTGYVFEEAPRVFIIDTSKVLLIIEVQTSWLDSIVISGNTRNLDINLTTFEQILVDRDIPGKEFIQIQFFFGGTPPSDLGFPTGKEWFSASELKTIFSRLRGAKNEKELILFRDTIKARYTLTDEGFKTYRFNINGTYVDEQYPSQKIFFRDLVTSTVNAGFKGYINLDLINKFTPDSFQIVGSDKEPELVTNDSIATMLDFYRDQTTVPFDIYYTKIENDFSNTNYKLFGENGFLKPFHPGFIIDLDNAGKAMPIWFKMVARPGYDIWENGTLLPDGKIIKITNFDIQPKITNPLTSPPDIRFIAPDGSKFYQGSGSFSVFVSGTNVVVDSTYLNAEYPNVRPYALKLEYNLSDVVYTPSELEAVKLDPSKWTDEVPNNLRVGQYVMTRVAINNPIFQMNGGDTMTPQTRVSGLLVHADQLTISPDLILTNSDIYGYSALDGQAKIEVAKLENDPSGNYLGADLQMSVETEFHRDASGHILIDTSGNPLVLRNPEGATVSGNYKDANGNDILDGNGKPVPILTIKKGNSIVLAPPLRTGLWRPAMKMNDWSVEGSFSQSDNISNLEWRLFEGQTVRLSLIPRVGDGTPVNPDFLFDDTVASNLDIELTNIKYIIETNGINYRFDQNQLKEITFASDDGGDVPYTGSSHISSLLIAVQILPDGTEKILTGTEIEDQVMQDFNDKVQIKMQLNKKNGTTQIASGTNISQFNELQNGDIITVSFESKDINFLLPSPITPLTIIVKNLFVRPLDSELFKYLRPNFTGSLNGSGSFNIRVTTPNSPKDDNETVLGFDQWYEYQVWNPDKTLKTEWTRDESKINNLVNGDKIEWKLVNAEGVLTNDYYNTLLASDSTDDNIKFRVVNVVDKIEQTFQNGIGSSQIINPNNPDGTPKYPEDSGWVVSGLKIEIILNPVQQEQFTLALKEFNPTFKGINKFGSMISNITNDTPISKEVVLVWYASGEDGVPRKITDFQDAKLSNGDKVWATIAPSPYAIENGLIIDDSIASSMSSEIFTVSGLEVIVNSPTQTLIISLITASSVLLVGITAALVFVKKNSKLKDNKIFKK